MLMVFSDITDKTDKLIAIIKDDPVRPEIPLCDRLGPNKNIFIEYINDKPLAVVCVSYQDIVPININQLNEWSDIPKIATFYTVWSYYPGAGRKIIFSVRDYILENKKTIKRLVTLSPPTNMARKFHLQNGAFELRINKDTINYEYK